MIHKNWQELIRPSNVSIKPGDDPKSKATIVTEPLERGFGLTLGNALRRILLSSLQGASIVSVQIDGVLHEFSSLAGVREDVTDIILNLKGVSVSMEVEGPKRLSVNVKGPGIVTAGDIEETNGIEILHNPIKAYNFQFCEKASILIPLNLHKRTKGILANITLTKARVNGS